MKKGLPILIVLLHSIMAGAQQDTRAALSWLEASLEQYFTDSVTMQQITTHRYAQFKTDAMHVDMNGGMSPAAFGKKWKHAYNIDQSGLYEGFLIPLQDWNRVKIACGPLPTDKPGIWIAAEITEEPSGEYFRRDIKLVHQKDNWRIDDVLAVMPLSVCINGDFDGDKKQDTLCATLISSIDGKPVFVDTMLRYDSLIASVIRQKPLLELKGDRFSPLLLNGNDYVLGLYYLAAIGNIDKHTGDEIGLVVHAADWSNNNLYKVYTYRKGKWSLLKTIAIKEEQLPEIRSGRLKPYRATINKKE